MALPLSLQQLWQDLQRASLFNYCVLALAFFALLWVLKLIRGSKLKLPPSPPKLPLIGNLHQLGTVPHRSLHTLAQKYGAVMLLQMGSAPTLVITSADSARDILKTHDIVFANRVQTKASKCIFGNNDVAFSPYGDYWRTVKKICVLELLSLKRVQSFQVAREEEVAEMMDNIRRCGAKGVPADLGEMFVNISFDIVSRAVLGRKFEKEDGKKSFGEAARDAMELFAAFAFEDLFPKLRWLDYFTGLVSRLNKTKKDLNGYLDQVIKEHKISDIDEEKKDFVDILLHLQKDGKLDINLTQDNLRAILTDMFIAGTDTTSTTLEWAMSELIKKPSAMKKAQEEVRRIIGKKSKIEESDLGQMTYMKWVLKETLRLHAPVPFLAPRESSADVKVEGFDVPPKTRVFVNVWAIQRDPKMWDKAEQFIPERFDNSPIDFKGQDFQYLPFGAGRRGCPGITFGMAEAELVLANVLHWFDWKMPNGASGDDLDMEDVYGLVVHRKNNLKLIPIARQSF